MKHNLNRTALVMVLTALSTGVATAADYTQLSNEELVQMRSQARELSDEDRAVYRSEMQGRMESMSSEERNQFRQDNAMGGQGNGEGNRNRYGQGQGDGSGSGNQYRYGQGNSSGSGNMNRYGQDSNQGYGSGYGSRHGSGGGSGNGGGRGRGR